PRALDLVAADAVLLANDPVGGHARLLLDLARVRARRQDLAPEGDPGRLLAPEHFEHHGVPFDVAVDHERKIVRVAYLEIDHGIAARRVEAHGDVRARPRVRQALDDVETREERRGVERARRLARPAADPLHHFALEDLPAFAEAVLDRARTDDGIE